MPDNSTNVPKGSASTDWHQVQSGRSDAGMKFQVRSWPIPVMPSKLKYTEVVNVTCNIQNLEEECIVCASNIQCL